MPAMLSLRRLAAICAVASLVFAVGCTDDSFFSYNGATNSGNFSTTVFLGDSYTAGVQNGSLCDKFQPNSWPAIVAKQAGFTIAQPLIASPGVAAYTTLATGTYTVPTNFAAFYNSYPTALSTTSGTTTGRDSSTATTIPTVLAFNDATLHDIINTKPVTSPSTTKQIAAAYVLGTPLSGQTQMTQAIAENPTTIFLWAGVADAMLADTGNGTVAGSAAMTGQTSFDNDYTTLLTDITAVNNAHIVILNIPDVTALPFMTKGSDISTAYGSSALTKLGIASGDLVNAVGVKQIPTLLSGPTVMPSYYVIRAADIATVQTNISNYNFAITTLAAEIGATVIDMNLAYSTWQTTPPTVTISGTTYTPTFGYLGGLFSTDGIHPTNTFQAIIANRILAALNTKLGTSITTLTGTNIGAIAAADPLFTTNIGKIAF